MILDIASIIFVCVTANHLGLISAIEGVLERKLVVVNCPKCFTFWSTLIYGCYTIATCRTGVLEVFAISFLSSYLAIWLELLEGYIDTFYIKCYDAIYSKDDTAASDADKGDTDSSVPQLREITGK